jgi:hypothetical protein
MNTKLMKIGMIAAALIFILVGPSWAKNNQQQYKHKKHHNKQVYQDDHVKKGHSGGKHWRNRYQKGHYRYNRPGYWYRRHPRYHRYQPYPHRRYHQHHYRKHYRRFDHHHSQNDLVIIGSVYEPGWGFTFATKGQY